MNESQQQSLQEEDVALSLFERIDRFSFQLVDQLKSKAAYGKIQSFLRSMPRESRPTLQKIFVSSFYVIPFLFIALLFIHNLYIRSQISKKQQILDTAQKMQLMKGTLEEYKLPYLTRPPLTQQSDLQERIRSMSQQFQLSPQNLTIKSFMVDPLPSGTNKITAVFSFKELSVIQLMDIFIHLTTQLKMTMTALQVHKPSTQSLLEGEYEVNLYSEDQSL
jgi:hypothetical protein